MLFRRSAASLAIACLVAAGFACGDADKAPPATLTPAAISQTAIEPRFAYESCDMDLPDGQEEGETVICGTLTVLENRASPGEGTIELALAILKSTGADPESDPLIYLAGGPGGPAIEYDMQLFTRDFAFPIQRRRDIVFFDQRGVGRSDPALDCPEVDDVYFDDEDAFNTALTECADRLRADGVDLNAYNSIENAADIVDLARALDYETYNLYGVSYGTRLALTAMRDAPDAIRSVVLDSSFPLQANLYADGASTLEESLHAVFSACGTDAACRRIAGLTEDIEATFFSIAERLDTAPITVEGGLPEDPYDVEIDGDVFVNLIFEALYSPFLIAELPAMLVAIDRGDTEPLELLASYSAYFNSGSSLGMHLSVQCSEEVPFNTPDRVRQATRPAYRRLNISARGDIASIRAGCGFWDVARGDARENEAVVSEIPALVLMGEFDPITPPSYGRATASTLSHSFLFEFRGAAHGVLDEACPMTVVASFIEQPNAAPDAACVVDLPDIEFILP